VYGATVESNGGRAQLNGGAKSNKCGKISDLPACETSTSTYRGREQRYLNMY
jgi:hypothetical protein